MSIRAVLDTSAILAYASGSIAVGELIGEFTDEGAQFGLPVLCLEAECNGSQYAAQDKNEKQLLHGRLSFDYVRGEYH